MTPDPRTGFYPGTFDPVTHGHMDIVTRAVRLFDRLVIGVAESAMKHPLLSLEERVALLEQEVAQHRDAARISVCGFDTLLVDALRHAGAGTLVRGIRSAGDFDFECQISGVMRHMAPEVETMFLLARDAHRATASRIVKEIARFGGDISPFVSHAVAQRVLSKCRKNAT